MKEHKRIIDFLRGMAALGVVMGHYSNKYLPTIYPNSLSDLLLNGMHGVQIFFVISGFIIPYSMYKSGYTLTVRNYLNSLLKRFIRIAPPAYISMLMTIAVYYLVILILHRPLQGVEWPGINFTSLFGNITFTVYFLDTSWFNPIFWTLAAEFQFYFLIGLLFPVLLSRNYFWISLVLLLLLLSGILPVESFFTVASFFVFGILVFLAEEKLISALYFYLVTVIAIGISFLWCTPSESLAGVLAMVFILKFNFSSKITDYLGKISYSLYITHIVIAVMMEGIIKRIVPVPETEAGKLLMLLVYTLIAIGAASIFYKYVELYFLNLSKKIRISNKSD